MCERTFPSLIVVVSTHLLTNFLIRNVVSKNNSSYNNLVSDFCYFQFLRFNKIYNSEFFLSNFFFQNLKVEFLFNIYFSILSISQNASSLNCYFQSLDVFNY